MVMFPVLVTGLAANFSPIPCKAPPPLGNDTWAAATEKDDPPWFPARPLSSAITVPPAFPFWAQRDILPDSKVSLAPLFLHAHGKELLSFRSCH
jgi:hypothetical protein